MNERTESIDRPDELVARYRAATTALAEAPNPKVRERVLAYSATVADASVRAASAHSATAAPARRAANDGMWRYAAAAAVVTASFTAFISYQMNRSPEADLRAAAATATQTQVAPAMQSTAAAPPPPGGAELAAVAVKEEAREAVAVEKTAAAPAAPAARAVDASRTTATQVAAAATPYSARERPSQANEANDIVASAELKPAPSPAPVAKVVDPIADKPVAAAPTNELRAEAAQSMSAEIASTAERVASVEKKQAASGSMTSATEAAGSTRRTAPVGGAARPSVAVGEQAQPPVARARSSVVPGSGVNGGVANRDAESSASINAALREAVRLGRVDDVRNAIARGADVNALDKTGASLLVIAARNGANETAFELLAAGANVALRNSAGMTALDYARRNNNQALIDALVRAGAR